MEMMFIRKYKNENDVVNTINDLCKEFIQESCKFKELSILYPSDYTNTLDGFILLNTNEDFVISPDLDAVIFNKESTCYNSIERLVKTYGLNKSKPIEIKNYVGNKIIIMNDSQIIKIIKNN